MSTKIKIRRDLKQNWEQYNPILADGELALIKDTGELKIGNGQSRIMEIPSINNNFNGYAWELVKEVNNYNLSEFIISTFDTEIVKILFETDEVSSGYVLNFNDDDDDNNYSVTRFHADPNNKTVGYYIGTSKLSIGSTTSKACFGEITIYPKINKAIINEDFYYTGSSHWVNNYHLYMRYLGENAINYIKFINLNPSDTKCYIRIYKLVQIVSQAPYKKLVASASKIKDINGIVINVDQDKKYEIEMSCNHQTSQKVCFLINNDNESNYIRRYKGVWDANSFSSGQENLAYVSIKWSTEFNQTHRGILYPFSKTYNCFYSRMNNSSQGYFENWNDTYLYQGGNIQTLNFIAPNDDISCKFKVWEITE